VTHETFIKLVRLLQDRHHGWTNELKMFVFLYWMACGCSYRVIGTVVGMNKKDVCKIIHRLLDFFVANMKHQIKDHQEATLMRKTKNSTGVQKPLQHRSYMLT
jgi:hypothetical protein